MCGIIINITFYLVATKGVLTAAPSPSPGPQYLVVRLPTPLNCREIFFSESTSITPIHFNGGQWNKAEYTFIYNRIM